MAVVDRERPASYARHIWVSDPFQSITTLLHTYNTLHHLELPCLTHSISSTRESTNSHRHHTFSIRQCYQQPLPPHFQHISLNIRAPSDIIQHQSRLRSPTRALSFQSTPSATAMVIHHQRQHPGPAAEPRGYQGLPRLCNNKDTKPYPTNNTKSYYSTNQQIRPSSRITSPP